MKHKTFLLLLLLPVFLIASAVVVKAQPYMITDTTFTDACGNLRTMPLGSLTNVNGTLFFASQSTWGCASEDFGVSGLWKSDGTKAGTVLVRDNIIVSSSTNVNGTLFFVADDEQYDHQYGLQLWAYNPIQSLSSGYFEITDANGLPITDKAVNEQFQIKVTARDAYGNLVNYSGSVSLWSNAGAVSPTSVYLTNGIWTGNATLYEAGCNIHLGASGGGRYGISNYFNVTGQGASLGSLYVKVLDNRKNPLSGAKVYLDINSDEIPDYEGTTNSSGVYQFINIPSGQYYLWAEYNLDGTKYSDKITTFISSNNRWAIEYLTVPLFPSCKTPVILVPGIMGSSMRGENNIYPKLPEEYLPDISKLVLHDPLGRPGWRILIDDYLVNNHYERDETIIGCPYDWRAPLETAVEEYLKPCIQRAKDLTGSEKVNIVAHSMGGLVTRKYIQSDSYENDIHKFVMVGTPNKGAVNAYYIWEGGDPLLADALNESIFSIYWGTIEKMYEKTYKLGNLEPDQNIDIWEFIHENVPGLRELLPDFAFLEHGDTRKSILSNDNKNTTLLNLNSDSKRSERMSPEGGSDVVKTRVFYSTSEDTIRAQKILNPNTSYQPPLYKDGVPDLSKQPVKQNGDGTVWEESAKLPCDEGWASCASGEEAEHSKLIGKYAGAIFSFIDEGEPTCFSQSLKMTNLSLLSSTSEIMNTMSVSIDGRVQPYLVDPYGRGCGMNPSTALIEDNIPSAKIFLEVEAGNISIENPVNGTYTIYIKGNYSEDYGLTIDYIDTSISKSIHYNGFNHENTISFTFTINSNSEDKMTINHTPVPPLELQADAVNSGNLLTQLTWNLSTDPNVDHYNIYSRYIDEPYLTQIGTSTGASFDTGHLWAENSTIKTRIYAVSAVKSDGTEGFLSDMMENNDRDHDRLTDERETSYGTNISNPDTDGDGLKDGEEYVRGTNPLLADTDGDGYNDYVEIQAGSDPLDPNSIPQYNLSVSKTGTGSGTVTSSPSGINCGSDCSETYSTITEVTLTAAPSAGSVFAGWTGCTPLPNDPKKCSLTVDKNTTVTAEIQKDANPPTGSIVINGGAEATKSTSVTLTLTASDDSGGTIQMCISNTTSCTSWTTFAATKRWTLTSGNGTKTVYAWFKDKWGNKNTIPYSDTIILDTTAPVNGTVTPTAGNTQITLNWTGFSDALSGIAGYVVRYASGSAPTSCTAGTAAPGYDGTSTTYTHTGLINGTTYGYRVCAIDKAGNMSTGATTTAKPVPETNPPTGSITINGGAEATKSTSVTLALTASDAGGGPIQMCVSNTAICTSFSAFAATKSWTLTSGSGTKTVNVWFRDQWGNTNPTPYSDTIILDTTAPTNGTVTATPGNTQITLNWTGFTDALSGIDSYKVVYATGSAPSSCSSGTTIYTGSDTSYPHTGLINGTTYGYRVCAIDKAGNMSTGAICSAKPHL